MGVAGIRSSFRVDSGPPWKSSGSDSRSGGKGKGKSKGKGKVKSHTFEKRRKTDSRDGDPPGSCRVYVMGFDIGTTDEQFEEHMGQAGEIHEVFWVTKHSAVVVYKKRSSKNKSADLDGTVIEGNE